MIQAVLLDLFGTVVAYGDVVEGTRLAWEGIYAVLCDLHQGAEQGACPEYGAFVPHWEEQFQVPLAIEDDVAETPFLGKLLRLFRSYGLPEDLEAASRAAWACLGGWDAHLFLPEDTLPALAALRGDHPLALVSNFDHPPYVRALLERLGLSGFFDAILISGELRIDKPDPRIFWQALQQFGCAPADAVHVGDSLSSDIAGARAAGCQPVLIDRMMRHAASAVPRIERLDELPELIRALDAGRSL